MKFSLCTLGSASQEMVVGVAIVSAVLVTPEFDGSKGSVKFSS